MCSSDLNYRAPTGSSRGRPEQVENFRSAVSYITGAHAVKVGLTHRSGRQREYRFTNAPLTYRFNNGVPNQLTMFATPFTVRSEMNADWGLYVQDRVNLGTNVDYSRMNQVEEFGVQWAVGIKGQF